jgi:circadian clock protein KaiC
LLLCAFNHYRLHKTPSGIKGFDEITEGGLPKNRTTLFSGSTGTGKTLLGIDFLINGATQSFPQVEANF